MMFTPFSLKLLIFQVFLFSVLDSWRDPDEVDVHDMRDVLNIVASVGYKVSLNADHSISEDKNKRGKTSD